jgi:hypothetical protein
MKGITPQRSPELFSAAGRSSSNPFLFRPVFNPFFNPFVDADDLGIGLGLGLNPGFAD